MAYKIDLVKKGDAIPHKVGDIIQDHQGNSVNVTSVEVLETVIHPTTKESYVRVVTEIK